MINLLAALFGSIFLFGKAKPAGAVAYGPYIPATGIPVDAATLDVMARTLWGEARSEGETGMQAVANVIMNRYRLAQSDPRRAGQWGSSVYQICKRPYQFSAWNRNDPNYPLLTKVTDADARFRTAKEIAMKALQYRLTDITGGAAFYHTKAVAPEWSKGVTAVRVIGSHKFYTSAQVA